jgi:hypothetical protein
MKAAALAWPTASVLLAVTFYFLWRWLPYWDAVGNEGGLENERDQRRKVSDDYWPGKSRLSRRSGGNDFDFDLKKLAAVLHVRRVKNGTPSTHPLLGNEMRALRRLQRESAPSPFVWAASIEAGPPL